MSMQHSVLDILFLEQVVWVYWYVSESQCQKWEANTI